jgi:hypothetical protein
MLSSPLMRRSQRWRAWLIPAALLLLFAALFRYAYHELRFTQQYLRLDAGAHH